MHFHHVLLVKAADKADAIKKARAFVDSYCNDCGSKGDSQEPESGWVCDWYQVGGRYAWREMPEALRKQINDGKGFYKDQKAILLDYAWKDAVDRRPEESEVLCLGDDEMGPNPFALGKAATIIQEQVAYIMQEIGEMTVRLHERGGKGEHDRHMLDRILSQQYCWDSHFYSAEHKRWRLTPEDWGQMREDPKSWFIVNLDLHD